MAGMPAKPEHRLKPRTQDAPSFVVTTSATPTETSFEPALPPIRSRRAADALDRAEAIMQAERRRSQATTDSRIGAALVSLMMLLGAVAIAQVLVLRDANQMLIHQREVAPRLAR
jgi:hypothetical protein